VPFTISHVAAVLPAHRLLRRYGLLSAAIIGSMVPDFGFLFPWPLEREQTHGTLALLKFCLPVGLTAWVLFQLFIKPAWGAVLPGRWRWRLRAEHPTALLGRWQTWVAAAAVILLGAITHLIWDGFTHEDGRGVRLLSILDDYGPDFHGHSMRLYRLLQHGSTLVGLSVVLAAAWIWADGGVHGKGRDAPAPEQPELSSLERHTWLAAYLLVPAALLAVSFAAGLHHPNPWMSALQAVTRLAYLAMSSLYGSVLLVSMAICLRLRRLST
jgi:hypothetical protein